MTHPEDEARIADVLSSAAQATDAPVGLAERVIMRAEGPRQDSGPGRRRPPTWAPLLAAAIVPLLAIGTIVAVNLARGDDRPPANQTPNPSMSSTTPSPTPSPTPTKSSPTAVTPIVPSAPATHPVPAAFRATSVNFLDADRGWALGDGRCSHGTDTDCAVVLGTTDGGSSWHALAAPADAVSTQDTSSCGDNGSIAGPCVDRILFATPRVGYLWSLHSFYMTTDGGTSWHALAGASAAEVVVSGNRVARTQVLQQCSARCQYGVYTAAVGSSDWQRAAIGPENPTAGLTIVSSASGFQVVTQRVSDTAVTSGQLFHSADGVSWTEVNSPLCGDSAVTATTSGPTGVLALLCPTGPASADIRVSSDGGRTLTVLSGPPASSLRSVIALSATQLLASTGGGTVGGATYLSSDGGRSWRVVVPESGPALTRDTLPRLAPAIAYELATSGLGVAISSDGGTSWHTSRF